MNFIETELELENARNEVLRKMGRNILLFQQIELALKILNASGNISGYISELQVIQEQQLLRVQKLTMGQLVEQFLESSFVTHEKVNKKPDELKEIYVSFNFCIENSAVFYETEKQALAAMVADRNNLVHHFLQSFNLQSIANCMEADHYLLHQREKYLPVFNSLKSMVNSIVEARKEHADFLISDTGTKLFEYAFLCQSPIVALLCDIATHPARPDGWTSLSIAEQLIRKHLPDEMATLNERYGHKKLKGLMLTTTLFDIAEEVTDNGGIRLLYKLKQE